jgi:uncharacterized protein YndB with AHSA1/START domain
LTKHPAESLPVQQDVRLKQMSHDSHIYTVVKEKLIHAEIDEVWSHLTEGELLTEWFADTHDLGPHAEFVFSFGDGDFFAGRVIEWEPPSSLQLTWKFMGVAQSFDIHFSLLPLGESTLLTLRDTGSVTAEEADGLVEGWEDFLMRLVQRIETKQRTRYVWSETIGVGALLGNGSSLAAKAFQDKAWWLTNFPDAHVSFNYRRSDAATFTISDDAWQGVSTVVKLAVRRLEDCLYIDVRHGGWTMLDASQQIPQRRRYAEFWARALQQLEQEAGIDSSVASLKEHARAV